MIVMESSLSNVSGATMAADVINYRTKQIGENTLVLKESAEKNSAYMANMVLPEIVQSSRAYPLGPDCVITHTECKDPSLMTNMDLYWYISLEKGCVECKIKHNELTNSTTTTDPRCIITRKPRRFEAYCCTFCRSNFVTVVQALLHMKAFHRQKMKIFIQDQNVFHDIEKAMEVPPVPLPWYAAKKIFSPIPNTSQNRNSSEYESISIMPSTGDSTEQIVTSTGENNPVTNLLQAIVKEYGKQVHTALFGKDFCDVKVQFEDKSVVIAQLPEMISQEASIVEANEDIKEKLEFRVERLVEENGIETCIVTVNQPALARHLIVSALKQGVSENSGGAIATLDKTEEDQVDEKEANQKPVNEILPSKDTSARNMEENIPTSQVKLDSRGRPSKTVRFTMGSPDDDEDDNSSVGEKSGWSEQEENKETGSEQLSDELKKPKEDEGLQGVVNQLISTASNCNLIPVDPTSPVSTASSMPLPNVREEILATAAMHVRSLPKNLSSPNLVMITHANSAIRKSLIPSSVTPVSGMSRAQSWAGKANADTSQNFTLSTYPRSTSPSFDHLPRADQRKFLTGGRAFTYAEKIRLMKMLNDQDSAITEKHIRRGLVAETSVNMTNTSTSTTMVSSSMPEKSRSSSSSSSLSSGGDSAKVVNSELSIQTPLKDGASSVMIGVKRKKNEWITEGRKKRKSKYDVPQFVQTESKTSLSKEMKKPTSDSSASDNDEKDTNENEQTEEGDNPPTLLNVMRSAYPAFLASHSGIFSGPTSSHIPTGYPAMLSSEYYGSGEWANAAMQTLRSLQSTIELQAAVAAAASSGGDSSLQSKKLDKVKNEPAESRQPCANSVTDELENPVFDETEDDFLTANDSTETQSHTEDTILTLANQITNEKSKLLVSQNSQRFRSLSPVSSHRVRADSHNSKSFRSDKIKDPKEKLKKLEIRSASDSNLKKRSIVSAVGSSAGIAQKGDLLEFLQNLTEESLLDDDVLLLKFHKKGSLNEDQSSNVDMPQIFQNSVETCMKVKYIEKISICRVCGYQITLSDESHSGVMKSHVMEHSLKELLQTGCNGRQFM